MKIFCGRIVFYTFEIYQPRPPRASLNIGKYFVVELFLMLLKFINLFLPRASFPLQPVYLCPGLEIYNFLKCFYKIRLTYLSFFMKESNESNEY